MCFKKLSLFILLFFILHSKSYSWGFYAHKQINRIAIYTLPKEMFEFYKKHIEYITEKAINPDKRRYILKNEAPRHYIDLEDFGDSALYKLPHHYLKIKELYSEDSLLKLGIVPWHIQSVCYQLTEAFESLNTSNILRLSADLGHYIADANVPLHTTKNYNGQLTNQIGIHGLWESRLPELFSDNYDLFIGKVNYINKIDDYTWSLITKSNSCLDSVLLFEQQLNNCFPEDKKYSFEQKGAQTIKVYSKKYALQYHQKLEGQVERQMRSSVKSISDLWYTCWINAGQPDLSQLLKKDFIDQEEPINEPINEKIIRPETHLILEEINNCANHHHCCENSEDNIHFRKWFVFWK